MRVIICGGRDYNDKTAAFRFLDSYHERQRITHVIEGGARGADRLGRWWAEARGIGYTTVNANWDLHDKRAEYLRNIAMRDHHNPDAVIAFPGGIGTRMMIDLAREKNITVVQGD
jgi:predicted Rossmann-fold nucleotide-binding protein